MAVFADNIDSFHMKNNKLSMALEVPVGIETLIYALLNSFSPRTAMLGTVHYSFVIPAGSFQSINLVPTKEGWSPIFISKFKTYSSVHSPEIYADYTIYGESTYRTLSYDLATDFEFDIRAYHGLVIQLIELWYENHTTIDTVITVDVEGYLVEKSLFDNVILPVLRQGFQHIVDYAESITKKRVYEI